MRVRVSVISVVVCLCSGLGAPGVLGQTPASKQPGEEALPPNAIVLSEAQWAAMQSPSQEVLAAMEKLKREVPPRDGSGRGVRLIESSLASEVSWRVERDQYWRSAGSYPMRSFENENDQLAMSHLISEQMIAVDEDNTAWLKGVVDDHGGWPKISEVGSRASTQLWLLAQHADLDRAFQKEVLAMMEPLVKVGEVEVSKYAYLYDRVAVGEGRPQRYGTQGYCVKGEDRWVPRDIENPDGIDELRAAAGMGPLADYIAQFTSGGLCG